MTDFSLVVSVTVIVKIILLDNGKVGVSKASLKAASDQKQQNCYSN